MKQTALTVKRRHFTKITENINYNIKVYKAKISTIILKEIEKLTVGNLHIQKLIQTILVESKKISTIFSIVE